MTSSYIPKITGCFVLFYFCFDRTFNDIVPQAQAQGWPQEAQARHSLRRKEDETKQKQN